MTAITATVGGRRLRMTNLDRIVYPRTGTTKGDVLRYYEIVGEHIIEQTHGRPVTRIRYPRGVGGTSFFEKNAPGGMPDWIPIMAVGSIRYPMFEEVAAVVWSAQNSTLEVHTPQWRIPDRPDRMVVDLDPGPGAGLLECCTVATLVADYIQADGLLGQPVTSGGKGMQLYIPFPEPMDAWAVVNYARAMASDLSAAHPDRIVATMSKQRRRNRVFIDWSQNNPAKTTITPYSLRGKQLPTAATPVTWQEVRQGLRKQFDFQETLSRVRDFGDLLVA